MSENFRIIRHFEMFEKIFRTPKEIVKCPKESDVRKISDIQENFGTSEKNSECPKALRYLSQYVELSSIISVPFLIAGLQNQKSLDRFPYRRRAISLAMNDFQLSNMLISYQKSSPPKYIINKLSSSEYFELAQLQYKRIQYLTYIDEPVS